MYVVYDVYIFVFFAVTKYKILGEFVFDPSIDTWCCYICIVYSRFCCRHCCFISPMTPVANTYTQQSGQIFKFVLYTAGASEEPTIV